MRIENAEIAKTFNHVADLLEIEGANPYRVRAYRNAARTLEALPESVEEIVHEHGDLTELPGIGDDLANKIKEIVETNHLNLLDELEQQTPLFLSDMLKIPSLGPKRVHLLYENFHIKSLRDLEKILENKRVLKVPGFGEKLRVRLLEEIKRVKKQAHPRVKLADATKVADALMKYLKESKEIQKLTLAGSFRRRTDTVGDLDILATAKDGDLAIRHFIKYPGISKILSQGNTRSTVLLKTPIQVDFRVVDEDSYGAAMLYFTGSKAHNIALRTMAKKEGLKINEYGVFKGYQRVASRTETDVYHALNLPYIEPELRENRGEIQAAQNGELPKLIQVKDIRGDLHVHTQATDGANTIEELVAGAKKHGYSYFGITDHSKHLTIAHGLDENRLLKQLEEIDRINEREKNITILKGIEVDILEDGTLDLSDEVLEKLDFTVCAIHSSFNLSEVKQTNRVLRAMENKYFRIFAHPTGRLINIRESYKIDLEKIIEAAKQAGHILEINSQPTRMELGETYCKMAKEAGVKMAVSTDTHNLYQFDFIKYGVDIARRGWLEKSDVINTLPLEELKKVLSRTNSNS